MSHEPFLQRLNRTFIIFYVYNMLNMFRRCQHFDWAYCWSVYFKEQWFTSLLSVMWNNCGVTAEQHLQRCWSQSGASVVGLVISCIFQQLLHQAPEKWPFYPSICGCHANCRKKKKTQWLQIVFPFSMKDKRAHQSAENRWPRTVSEAKRQISAGDPIPR